MLNRRNVKFGQKIIKRLWGDNTRVTDLRTKEGGSRLGLRPKQSEGRSKCNSQCPQAAKQQRESIYLTQVHDFQSVSEI